MKKTARTLLGGIRSLSPNCREATRLQSDALDRPLPRLKQAGLRIHLVLCRWCRRYGRQLLQIRQTVRNQADAVDETLPMALSAEAKARLQRALRDATK